MPESDRNLPENSKESLDRKLDHAVKETFPTSDPVSVTITKGGAIDYDEKGKPITEEQAQGRRRVGEGVLGQATETLTSAASTASEMARGAYEQGQRYGPRSCGALPSGRASVPAGPSSRAGVCA